MVQKDLGFEENWGLLGAACRIKADKNCFRMQAV
jgi:hypothetical protein